MTNPRFTELAQSLPKLTFDPAIDNVWAQEPEPQAYLDYYQINLAREHADVMQGLGRVRAGGFDIATHYWLPENARGTLVVVHGYYDHVGLYGHALRFGLERGLAVLAFDLPGHGLSSGDRASILSFDQYADVLHEVLNASESFLPRPWHCLAQSTGGAAVLNYLWRHSGERFTGIALCAPLILPWAWRTSRLLYWLARPWVKKVRRVFVNSSHNHEFNHFLSHRDGLQAHILPVAWVTAMRRWNAAFVRYPKLDKSLLVVQGTADKTVDWRYNLMQIQRKLPNARTHMVEGAYHQLVNESDQYRQDVLAAIGEWIAEAEREVQ